MIKNAKTMLAQTNPKLAREWHPTKNAPLTPKDVTPGSHKKALWVCRMGHEWSASVKHRVAGSGCPYCAGKRATKENCLLTVSPAVAREWHPTKNAPLMPQDVPPYSNKRAWWICKEGHVWTATIAHRSTGKGCPFCAGRQVNTSNSLRTLRPELSRQWHPTKNAPLTPGDVVPGSGKSAWWVCGKGHEWKTRIVDREYGYGCPYCAGQKVGKDNCLQTVNPGLVKEWHPTRNIRLTPKDVTSQSHKKAWWTCRKGHEWEAVIASRNNGRGCPYCAGQKVSVDNCLRTVRPELAREWHPARNAPLTPKDVTPRSDAKVWWICRRGHEWEASLSNRSAGRGCPFCSGHRPTKDICLETRAPWLAREWHPTKNGSWTPKDVLAYSRKQMWWECKNGHELREPVVERYKRGGCPVCVLKRKAPRLFERAAGRT